MTDAVRRAGPRRWHLPSVPTGGPAGGVVGLVLVVLVAVGAVLAPTAAGPTMVLLVAAVAVVWLALADAVVAIVLLVAASFLRPVLHVALPVDVPVPILLMAVALAGLGLAVARGTLPWPTVGAGEVAMALYLAWNVVSWASPHDLAPLGSTSVPVLIAWGTAFPFVLYVIGRLAGGSDRLVRALLWSVLGATAYSAAHGIAQFHGPAALVWPRSTDGPTWPGRAVGVVNQPVTNGVLLVVGVAVCLYLAVTAGSRRLRVLAAAVAVAASYTIYLTHTRAVWLAAVVVTVLAVGVRELRRAALGLLAAGAVVVVANWDTFVAGDRAAGGVGSTNEIEDRLNMIATAWWAIGEHPWIGWGVARFQNVNVYYHQQWSPETDWRRGFGIASHENELGIAAEVGLVGLALWLVVLALLARQVWRLLRRPPGPVRSHGLLAAAALVTLVVAGTTVDLRYLDFAEGVVLLLVGVAVGRGEAADREPGGTARSAATGVPAGAIR